MVALAASGCGTGETLSVDGEATTSITSITVSGAVDSLMVGDTLIVECNIHLSSGEVPNCTQQAVWESSDSGVLVVYAPGRVVAKGPGAAQLSVTFSGRTATVSIRVVERPPELLRLRIEGSATLKYARPVHMQCIGEYNDGSAADLTGFCSWSYDDFNVGEVLPGGLLVPHTAGSLQVVVTFLGRSASLSVAITGTRRSELGASKEVWDWLRSNAANGNNVALTFPPGPRPTFVGDGLTP